MLGVPARLLAGAVVGTLMLGLWRSETQPVLQSAVTTLTTGRGTFQAYQHLSAPEPAFGFARLSFDFYTQPTTDGMRADLAEAAAKEPENAFWQQALTVAFLDENDLPNARRAWIRGSQCGAWKDYYPEMSALTVEKAQAWFGGNWAWFQLLARDVTPGGLGLQKVSAKLIATAPPDEKLNLKLASFRHGRLIRDFCPRLDGARKGISLVFDPTSEQTLSDLRRGLWIGRFNLAADLRRQGRTQDAADVEQIFLSSDSWSALEDLDAEGTTSMAFYPVLPTAILLAGFAVLILIASRLRLSGEREFSQWQVGAVAAAAGVACLFLLRDSSVWALLVAAAIGLQAFRGQTGKGVQREHFPITAHFFAFCTAVLVTFAIYNHIHLRPADGVVPRELWLDTARIAIVVVSFTLLIARVTAWFSRRPGRAVGRDFLRSLGQSMLVLAGLGLVIGLPLITVWDAKMRTEYEKIRLNEPKYAWSQLER